MSSIRIRSQGKRRSGRARRGLYRLVESGTELERLLLIVERLVWVYPNLFKNAIGMGSCGVTLLRQFH
ncbi:MAG TPA: hypothetical protein VEI95_06170, partial [Acidobacteriota bacterium]|nr:hypothetical protein [Acidobacteriota bacterium]